MLKDKKHIVVYGCGAWGTALALSFLHTGHKVTLLARQENHAAELIRTRVNKKYLVGVTLPELLGITADKSILTTADVLLWAIPVAYTEEQLLLVKSFLSQKLPIIICSKGILQQTEGHSPRLLSQLMAYYLPNPLAVLSGPNFANEVAQGLPAGATLAGGKTTDSLSLMLRHSLYRIYASNDIIGVQIGGAIKNVLAIACGVVIGKKFGANALATVITRGLAEMNRLGQVMGALQETFLGLSGVGDLTLTCSSSNSRNTSLGIELAKGGKLNDILANRHTVAEGVSTAKAVWCLKNQYQLQMPLCEGVYQICYEGKDVDHVIHNILSNQSVSEVA